MNTTALEALLLSRPEGVIGIDPGLSGAVALLQNNQLQVWRDFKEREDIARAVKVAVAAGQVPLAQVVIEGVHAMPGQGVTSMFSFGTAFGVAQGAVWTACDLPVTFVAPLKWQNWVRNTLGLPKGPIDSRAIAAQVFAAQADLFKRKKDHNTADAALMALWGLANL
jgi:crossover junction endodeoxyribonuclease RuvC